MGTIRLLTETIQRRMTTMANKYTSTSNGPGGIVAS
jgi:hypothetical protein